MENIKNDLNKMGNELNLLKKDFKNAQRALTDIYKENNGETRFWNMNSIMKEKYFKTKGEMNRLIELIEQKSYNYRHLYLAYIAMKKNIDLRNISLDEFLNKIFELGIERKGIIRKTDEFLHYSIHGKVYYQTGKEYIEPNGYHILKYMEIIDNGGEK